MKAIGQKIWNEPAAFIGVLVSLGLLIANLLGDPSWSAQEIIEIIAPLATALGIRSQVTPVRAHPEGTTYRPPPKVSV